MKPDGWLRDPKGKWLLCFVQGPISSQKFPQTYIDKWDVSPIGTPDKFVNRRIVGLEPAIETWDELISSGWLIVDNQFGNAA